MNRRALFTLLSALVLLAVASSWLSFESSEQQRRQHQSARQTPDYYLQQAEIVTLDEHGQATQRLHSSYLGHYQEQGYALLREAQLQLLQTQGESWRMNAGEARLELEGDRLILKDQVRVQRTASAGGEELSLETEHLILHPESRFAETDAPLRLSYPQGVLTATGLHAYLDQQRLELLSEVSMRYEP